MDTATYGQDEYASKPEPKTDTGAPDADDSAPGELSDDELVERAQECYRLGVDALSQWRQSAREDEEFLAGEQWDQNTKGQRDAQGRPALTVNRLPQFVRQVTNEQRQSKPSVTVSPVDAGSDKRTAEVLQGVIRNIEYSSNADAAYSMGGQSAATTGLGYWDVCADYEDERSFQQTLSIRRITNPSSVVMDPSAKELAGDDARWVIKSWDMSKAEWDASYPGRDIPKGGGWKGQGDEPQDWVAKDGVRIHEYRWIEETPDELIDVSQAVQALPELGAALEHAGVDTSTGAVLASEVGPDFAAKLKAAKAQVRKTTKPKALYARIAGSEVVEREELAGKYLQLVRVVGTELYVAGKPIYEGVIRHAKDSQRMLNYAVSSEAEAIALAPKAPWLMAEGQDEDHEEEWREANKRPLSRLLYKPTSINGTPVPPPQRVQSEANIGAITQSRQLAAEDLNAVTGIYPTQFGAPSPEQSGKAILARQSQGNTTNFHFQDNFAMAIRYTGRILIDLIPKFYSGPRILRILGDDGSQEMVPVNGAQGEFRGEQHGQPGGPVIQLDAGRYDVAVSMGPSYLSRRQEANAMMMELIKVNPSISPLIADLFVRSMDIPGGEEIAERLQKMLPPQLRPPDDNQPPPQVLAQQVQEQGQVIQQMSQRLHELSGILESKAHESASKERIALINAQTELVKTAATIKSDEAQAMLDRTADLIALRLKLDGLDEPEDADDAPTGAPPPSPGVPNAAPRPGVFAGHPGVTGAGPGGAGPFPGTAPGFFPGGGPGGPGGLPTGGR